MAALGDSQPKRLGKEGQRTRDAKDRKKGRKEEEGKIARERKETGVRQKAKTLAKTNEKPLPPNLL